VAFVAVRASRPRYDQVMGWRVGLVMVLAVGVGGGCSDCCGPRPRSCCDNCDDEGNPDWCEYECECKGGEWFEVTACERRRPDAAVRPPDAASLDGGIHDGGTDDAGAADAAVVDAGT